MAQNKMKVLAPIKETTDEYEKIEQAIIDLLKKEIYLPTLKEFNLPKSRLVENAGDNTAVIEALQSGQITFNQGVFAGRFNAGISRELKSLGASWQKKTSTFRIQKEKLPQDIVFTIDTSQSRFIAKLAKVDASLAKILPEEIADRLKVSKYFDQTMFKVEKEFKKSVKNLVVTPKLTESQAATISKDWENNLKLFIKDFTEKQIKELRADMKSLVISGGRYESAIKKIQTNYGVTENKARFLARQESALMMAKFKEVRYQDAGINLFIWGCVAGSKNHPVRPEHKILENKFFSWDHNYEVDSNGKRVAGGVRKPDPNKNPGEDYNCRCFPKPVVKF